MLGTTACRRESPAPAVLTVFAAASTAELVQTLGRRFEASSGAAATINLAASSALARQIEAGAHCDVFISANRQWIDHLITTAALSPEHVRPLVRNRLVLVVPKDAAPAGVAAAAPDTAAGAAGSMDPWPAGGAGLQDAPNIGAWLQGRVALGDPQHVPAGQYARQALEKLGLWDQVPGRLVPAPDVRAALQLVELGEVDAAIVFSTDARVSPGVRVAAEISPDLHEPAIYFAARCSDSPLAMKFMELLFDPETASLYRELGFGLVTDER
jgi:molybdate transport system substrate-binding protein